MPQEEDAGEPREGPCERREEDEKDDRPYEDHHGVTILPTAQHSSYGMDTDPRLALLTSPALELYYEQADGFTRPRRLSILGKLDYALRTLYADTSNSLSTSAGRRRVLDAMAPLWAELGRYQDDSPVYLLHALGSMVADWPERDVLVGRDIVPTVRRILTTLPAKTFERRRDPVEQAEAERRYTARLAEVRTALVAVETELAGRNDAWVRLDEEAFAAVRERRRGMGPM